MVVEPVTKIRAAGEEFAEDGEMASNNSKSFGKKVQIDDDLDNFVFLTRSVGHHGTNFCGSGVVVEGREYVYLATAAHK